jgi:signal transduction histidine kinase
VPRKMYWMAIVWIALQFPDFFLAGSPLDYYSWPSPLPQAIPIAFILSLVASLFYRYRFVSGMLERQQIRWVMITGAFFGCLFAPSFTIWNWTYIHRDLMNVALINVILKITYLPLIYLSSAFFAVGIGISILRYHLWDIDIIINRTLVYGALTVIVIGIYVLVVGTLSTAIQGSGNLLISILATGLVAVLVQPLRDRLQRGVNRMMYGERDDPVTVLSRLGQRLEATIAPEAVLPALTETIAQTLKLPYAAITWGDTHDGEVAAAHGQPAGELAHLPLTHQGETIGQLVVAPRAPGEAFSPADRHLLKNIAHQAGMAVRAVALTADLQRSRQHLVTAREEERRRLRRDLHDGLGPNLASQGLKLAAVKQLLEKDPASAIPLLDQVMIQNQSTVEEVRRLVYGLRPPALDELGLVAAIRDYVSGMDGKSNLHIEITQPPEGLPPLSAAVEVAAYRIVLEALTNVIRHAEAQRCMILFTLDQRDANRILQIEIQDDGIGLPSTRRAGVGTRSMRERAEELGGTCDIESVMGNGTRVCARVPLIMV